MERRSHSLTSTGTTPGDVMLPAGPAVERRDTPVPAVPEQVVLEPPTSGDPGAGASGAGRRRVPGVGWRACRPSGRCWAAARRVRDDRVPGGYRAPGGGACGHRAPGRAEPAAAEPAGAGSPAAPGHRPPARQHAVTPRRSALPGSAAADSALPESGADSALPESGLIPPSRSPALKPPSQSPPRRPLYQDLLPAHPAKPPSWPRVLATTVRLWAQRRLHRRTQRSGPGRSGPGGAGSSCSPWSRWYSARARSRSP